MVLADRAAVLATKAVDHAIKSAPNGPSQRTLCAGVAASLIELEGSGQRTSCLFESAAVVPMRRPRYPTHGIAEAVMPHLLSGKRGSKSSQSRPFRSSQEDLPVAMWSGSHLSGGPEHGSFDVHSPCGVGAFILLGLKLTVGLIVPTWRAKSQISSGWFSTNLRARLSAVLSSLQRTMRGGASTWPASFSRYIR